MTGFRSSFGREAVAPRGVGSAGVRAMRATYNRHQGRAAIVQGLRAMDRQLAAVPSAPARTEIKTCDVFNAAGPGPIVANVDSAGSLTLLNGIQAGSSFYNRVGRKINMKSLHLIGSFQPTGSNVTTPEYARVMVIYDRQPNGAAPTASSILTSYDNAGNQLGTSYAHLNPTNSDRFRVLADVRMVMPDGKTTAETSQEAGLVDQSGPVNVNRFIKLRGLETVYKASSNPAVVGDISTGSLYLFTFGYNGTGASQFAFTTRLRYYDA